MDMLASFGFWLVSGGISVVLSIFTALALPTWNFSFLLSVDMSALAPVIAAAHWAINFDLVNQAFGVTVTSLMAYTAAVFYWKLIGGQFMSANGVQSLVRDFGSGNFLPLVGDLIKKWLGVP